MNEHMIQAHKISNANNELVISNLSIDGFIGCYPASGPIYAKLSLGIWSNLVKNLVFFIVICRDLNHFGA